jgi:hypothetical protein
MSLICLASGSVSGQITLEPIVSTTNGIQEVNWLDDASLVYTISRVGSTALEDTYVTSFVENESIGDTALTDLETPQIALPPLRIAYDEEGNASRIFVSPNENFAVYASNDSSLVEGGYSLALTDLRTQETYLVSSSPVFYFTDDEGFDIEWNDDSSAFVASRRRTSGDKPIDYITGFAEMTPSLLVTHITDDGILVGNERIYSYRVFDISINGDVLLLEDYSNSSTRLVMWNTEQPQLSQVLHEDARISAARFGNSELTSIYYVASDGLFNLDLLGIQTRLVDAEINSRWVYEAWFSPNFERVALLSLDFRLQRQSLFVTNIAN